MSIFLLIIPLLIVFLLVIVSKVANWREQTRQKWLSNSMKNSKMLVPAVPFVPGEMIIEETVPVPEDENSTSFFVSNWKERKARQREHAQAMALKRLHERSCLEHARRSEVDAAIKRAYASLGKEIDE